MIDQKYVPSPCEFDPDAFALCLDEVVPSEIRVIPVVVARILSLIKKTGCWDDLDDIRLALDEALANAIIHGNGSNSAKSVRICVAVQNTCEILIVVKDSGSGFDPDSLPDPVAAKNLFSSHGRGVYFIKQLMDDVQFDFEHGTAVYMRKRWKK